MIHLELPYLPPSVNHAYLVIKLPRGSKRTLTPEGRKFKKEATAHLSKVYGFLLKDYTPNRPYTMLYRFTMPDLCNKTWPKTAESRYKKTDTSNRFKLLEDVLADVLAVDDSHYFTVAGKRVTGPAEKTDIWIWKPDQEGSPLDHFIDSL